LSASAAGFSLSKKKVEDIRHYTPWAAIFRLETDWTKIFARHGEDGSSTQHTLRELFLVGKDLGQLRQRKTTSRRSKYLKLALLVLGRQDGAMPCPDLLIKNFRNYECIPGGVLLLESRILLYFAQTRAQKVQDAKVLLPLDHLLQVVPNKAHVLAFNTKRQRLNPIDVVAKVISAKKLTYQGFVPVTSLQYEIYFPRFNRVGTLNSQELQSVEKVLAGYLKSKYPRVSVQYELVT
jgi:hypothetical protein